MTLKILRFDELRSYVLSGDPQDLSPKQGAQHKRSGRTP